jgi:hypothetical protein
MRRANRMAHRTPRPNLLNAGELAPLEVLTPGQELSPHGLAGLSEGR